MGQSEENGLSKTIERIDSWPKQSFYWIWRVIEKIKWDKRNIRKEKKGSNNIIKWLKQGNF